MWRGQNVPVPEPYLLGIAAGAWLQRVRPWRLPGPRSLNRVIGSSLVAVGTYLVARSVLVAGQVDLDRPDELVPDREPRLDRHLHPEAVFDSSLVLLLQSFEVSCSPKDVWEFFGDIERVVRCLPGASLTRPPDGDRVDGKFSARLGPITATFTGAARIVRDDEKLRGVVLGAGNDRLSGSRAAGEIEYVLLPAGGRTRVELVIRALLAGPLAQFGRSGIVEDLVSRVAQAFARNLEGRLMGSGSDIETPTSAPLAAGSLLRQVLATRLKAVLARLFHLGR